MPTGRGSRPTFSCSHPRSSRYAELLCILRVQSLPAELHRLRTNDAAEGGSAEQVIQNIEANVPPGSTHRNEAAIDVGPQRQPRAATNGLRVATAYRSHPSCTRAPWERRLASRLFR